MFTRIVIPLDGPGLAAVTLARVIPTMPPEFIAMPDGTPLPHHAALLDPLREGAYDLVVMTTHDRAGIRRWAVGSVAERLVEASHTPVLLHSSDATR
jgi:hypothetical protein